MTYCYLFHFDKPVGKQQHYIGSTADLGYRLMAHFKGRGSVLTRRALSQGISISLVRLWIGSYRDELQLKKRGGKYYCPLCK